MRLVTGGKRVSAPFQYVDHYNRSRPHRALDLETPEPNEQGNGLVGASRVCRRTRLGGLISEYYQAA